MFHAPVTLARACALALAVALPLLSVQSVAAPAPIGHFFQNPTFSNAKLSPDAKSLAVLSGSNTGRDRLAVVDLVNNTVKIVAQFSKADVRQFEWVNKNRLVFDSKDKSIGPGDARYGPGLYAVDRDGANFKQLVEVVGFGVDAPRVGRTVLPRNHFLAGLKGAQDSNSVYLYSTASADATSESTIVNLVRLDTVTGRATTVPRPGRTTDWLLDHAGEPRLATTLVKNLQTIHYLDPVTKAWRELATFDGYLGGSGAFAPVGFSPDGSLYVRAKPNRDKDALYTLDLDTGKLAQAPLIALEDFDFSGSLIADAGKLLGVTYLSDARSTVWFDEKMKATQAAIDALLPDTVNLVSVAARAELPLLLVASYSDRQPYKFSLFNSATGKLSEVGQAYPSIKPAEMAGQEIVRVMARDKLMVPAWLTLPNGARRKALPMVVLVHGGPYVRGSEWGWNAQAQFLASRG